MRPSQLHRRFYFFCLLGQVLLSTSVMIGDENKYLEKMAYISSQSAMSHTRENENDPDTADRDKLLLTEIPCKAVDSAGKSSFNCSAGLAGKKKEVKQCGRNTHLVGELCICKESYRKFPESDFCVKVQGQHCFYDKNDCSTGETYLSCLNGVCQCDDSDLYDPISMRCVGKVGGLCYPKIKDCVVNAECVNVPVSGNHGATPDSSFRTNNIHNHVYYQYITETGHDHRQDFMDYILNSSNDIELSGRCNCKDGFVESEGGLCKKGFGQMCTSHDECDQLNLVCKEGVCVCPDLLQVYDLISKSCVALAGTKCSHEPGGTLCTRLASCKRLNLKLPSGRCACVDGAVETVRRTCVREEEHGLNPSIHPRGPEVERHGDYGSPRITFVY